MTRVERETGDGTTPPVTSKEEKVKPLGYFLLVGALIVETRNLSVRGVPPSSGGPKGVVSDSG